MKKQIREFNKTIGYDNSDCSNIMKQLNAINLSVMVCTYFSHHIVLYGSMLTSYIKEYSAKSNTGKSQPTVIVLYLMDCIGHCSLSNTNT